MSDDLFDTTQWSAVARLLPVLVALSCASTSPPHATPRTVSSPGVSFDAGVTLASDAGALRHEPIAEVGIDAGSGELVEQRQIFEAITIVTRSKGNERVRIAYEAPAEQTWFTCRADADCTGWVDTCGCCPAAISVHKRFAAKLRKARQKTCPPEPPPCPAAVCMSNFGSVGCVLGLCGRRPPISSMF